MKKPVVFVCRDQQLGEMLDVVASQLEAEGFAVLRGAPPIPGVKRRFTEADRAGPLAEAGIIVVTARNLMTAEDIAACRKAIAIVNPTIGLDMVDMEAAGAAGLIVGHGAMPENFLGIAEATVMLLTVLFYNLPRTERVLREGLPRPTPTTQYARMLRGATIGFVGYGRIGRAARARLAGWEVRALAYDPHLRQADVPDATLVDLDTLLTESDAVSLHVVLDETTRNLIGERELRLMKRGSYLVNTSRGGVIDEPALIRALEDGHLAGAALDVTATEPLPADDPLRRAPNLVLTPHMVGHTRQVFAAMGPTLLENILCVARGELPTYCKNPEIEGRWRERMARLERTVFNG